MRKQDKDKSLAKKLLQVSMDGQHISAERVHGVLAWLRDKQPVRYRQVLVAYLHQVERQVAFTNAVIESATILDANAVNTIQHSLSTRYGRPVTTEVRQNPALIAGIRIHLADDVWDDTVSSHLENLIAKV